MFESRASVLLLPCVAGALFPEEPTQDLKGSRTVRGVLGLQGVLVGKQGISQAEETLFLVLGQKLCFFFPAALLFYLTRAALPEPAGSRPQQL